MLNWLRNMFNGLIIMFKRFIKEAFPVAKQIIIAQLLPFALEIVKKLETTDFSNNERRNQAFNEIKKEAVNKGITVATSLIFCIIEIAIQKMKAE